MYRHTIVVEVEDDIIHAHSIPEWEKIFLELGIIQRDELPLSYGRVAEILAEEYHKYGMPYFNNAYGTIGATGISARETTNTQYVNEQGNCISTRLVPATPEQLAKVAAGLMTGPDEPGTMQIGIKQY